MPPRCLATMILTPVAAIQAALNATATGGNATSVSAAPVTLNLNLTTAAVATLVFTLLGLAAGLLLMVRYAEPGKAGPAEPAPGVSSEKARGKRAFLKVVLASSLFATVGGFASFFRVLAYIPAPGGGAPLAWPVVKVTNISSFDASKPLRFSYPLVETPCVLVKCGQPAAGGVGPDSDIVAFSDVCQHLGCFYSVLLPGSSPPCNSGFHAPIPQGYCCCHGGQYDYLHGGHVIGGPPPRAVPQVVLTFDDSTGDIYATSMTAPTIFGHGPPGTTDPAQVMTHDLTGGTIVTDSTVSPTQG